MIHLQSGNICTSSCSTLHWPAMMECTSFTYSTADPSAVYPHFSSERQLNSVQTSCLRDKSHSARITATRGYPSFLLRIGTTDETPSNNEMIPYLPLITALAGVADFVSVWLFKILFGNALQQAVPGVQSGGLSCSKRSFSAYAASLIPLSSLDSCLQLTVPVCLC